MIAFTCCKVNMVTTGHHLGNPAEATFPASPSPLEPLFFGASKGDPFDLKYGIPIAFNDWPLCFQPPSRPHKVVFDIRGHLFLEVLVCVYQAKHEDGDPGDSFRWHQ